MFDLFRSREKSVRILLGVLLGLVALSMLVYLIPGGLGGDTSAAGQDTIAIVGDEKITTVDVERAVDNITRSQPNFPRSMLGFYVPSLINQIVEEKAMAYQARRMGLRVSDEELSDSIQTEFQQQLNRDFDPQVYQQVVQNMGMTVPDFERQRRDAMLATRLEALEQQSIIVTDQEARAEYQRRNEKVALDYILFDPKTFAARVSKDPAAIKAYFEKNRALFRTPEKRDGVLVAGSTATFMAMAKVSDDQLRKTYNDNIDSYRLPERVRVRHILIKTQGKPKEDEAKAKAKAEDILKQLQHGGNFAELAKKYSEDTGSAEKGGELGWITHGQTVPNFDKTAFSLQPGQLSGVVQTEYGYHIIQGEEKQPARTETFEEVKPQLLAEAQKQMAADDLGKAINAAHDEIAKKPAQADAIAKKYNLQVYNLNNITNTSTLPDANSPELLNAIFSTFKGGVTNVVNEDNQGKDAFAIVTNILPAHNANFNEVEAQATQRYIESQSQSMAQSDAAKAAADVRKGESLQAVAKTYGATVKTAPAFTVDGVVGDLGSALAFSAAFKDKLGAVLGPVAVQSGQVVAAVTQKLPADMSLYSKSKDAIVQSLTQQRLSVQGALFRDSIVSDLRHHGKIKTNQDNITRLTASFTQQS